MHFVKFWGRAVRIAAAFLLISAVDLSAQTVPRIVLSGHRPAVVSHLQPVGELDHSARLNLAISLPLRNRDALTNLLDQLYDSASPLYHHFLTPDDFDGRFGPTEADYQSVIDWANRNHFTITGRHPNRLLLNVSASVGDIESALRVTLRTYQHPTEQRTFFAPDAEPSLDTDIPISYIAGLDNYARPHPKDLHRTPLTRASRATPRAGSGPNGNLAGFDYRAVYAPGVSLTGAGQQIGLVELDGFYANDITQYESNTGVSNVPVQTLLFDGFNGRPHSANVEVALDIEMAISMAPGLSKVVVYETGNSFPTSILQAMSTNTAIKQFSCSWYFGALTSGQESTMDTYFQKFDSQGQAFFDASGDTGATNSVEEPPSDDPYITQVGGTTLATAGPLGPWLSEVVWNAGYGPGVAGSSGGTSAVYAIPAWQKGVNMATNGGSTSYRNYPDVSMVADNIYIVADNGTPENISGTSAATPLWAGFAALANQQAAAIGGVTNSIGFINPAIYYLGTNAGFTACFDDVTVGNNTNFNAKQYLAVPGYDLCTGWGSPSGSSLIIALTQPDGFRITPGRGPVANGPAGGLFSLTNVTFTLTNSGKPAFNWTLGCTSAWLTVSSRSGTLNSNGTATVTVTLNSAANLLAAGVYAANLWFTNQTSGLAQLRQFTLQAGQNLVQDGGFEAGDFCYWNLSGDSSTYSYNAVLPAESPYAPHAGEYYAGLGDFSSLSWLSQSLPTRPGQIYELSIWLENPQWTGGFDQFEIQWNTNSSSSNTLFNASNMAVFNWSNLVYVVQATTNITTLEFGARYDNTTNFFALDDVSVLPAPAPTAQVTRAGKTFDLTWPALSGLSYQVQYMTNLLTSNWVNLGAVVKATNTSITAVETNGPDAKRFYRVELLP